MDNGDDWRKLRDVHYAKDEILRLCDLQRWVRLSQHLLYAVLFDQEILALTGDVTQLILPPEKLRCLVRLLWKHSLAGFITDRVTNWWTEERLFNS